MSLLYLTYVLGSFSSTFAGIAADRLGRRAVMPLGAVIAFAGVALTLVDWLPTIVVGLAGLTSGFFVMHGVASGWVAVRAHAVGASASQAAAFYLCAYYVGSSVCGTLGGSLWTSHAWPGVAVLGLSLLTLCGLAAVRLRRLPLAVSPRG